MFIVSTFHFKSKSKSLFFYVDIGVLIYITNYCVWCDSVTVIHNLVRSFFSSSYMMHFFLICNYLYSIIVNIVLLWIVKWIILFLLMRIVMIHSWTCSDVFFFFPSWPNETWTCCLQTIICLALWRTVIMFRPDITAIDGVSLLCSWCIVSLHTWCGMLSL